MKKTENSRKEFFVMGSMNAVILRRIFKIIIFFGVILSLFFCITWQNLHMYLLNKRIEKLAQERNELEKSHYLLNIELSHLKSRDRIRKIAREELDMVPIIYKDVKLIIY